MIKERMKKLPSLLSGALICAVLMLVVYALKGVWPFGAGNVTYDDMAQGTLPIYYHLYDWLHGEKAMAFDWYTGLGTNIANSGTFMPLDLILCLFRREKLLYGIGILIIVKVMASAATAKYVFDRLFTRANELWRVLFSVIYAMSAYSMFYYTNSFWLDFVVIFPLVIYGLKKLLVDGKPLVYILFFAYTIYLSIYIGFMVTLSVFFLGGLYLIIMCDKEKRGQRTCLLGLGTVTGALLSAWHAVPMAIQTFSSKRLETSFEDATQSNPLLEMLMVKELDSMPSKLMLLIGLQLCFVLAAVFIIKLLRDKQRRKALFVTGSIFLMFAPVIFENTNLFWHGGSYVQFTMRFFFCSVFTAVCVALACIDTYGETLFIPKSKFVKAIIFVLCIILTVGFVAGVLFFAQKVLGKLGNEDTYSYAKAIGFGILFATGLPLFTLLLCQKKHVTKAFCFVLCTLQTLGLCYAGVANTHQQKEEEVFYNSPSYLEYCQEVAQLDLDCGELGRIKNPDTSLNTNYPFILKTPALSNWTHNIPLYMQNAASVLGYSTQYTRILDSGGTAFSDGIIGIKKVIMRSINSATPQLTEIGKTESFTLYSNDYALDFGLLGDEALLGDITSSHASSRFEVQNKLYRSLTGSEEKLFEVCSNKGEVGERLTLTKNDKQEIRFTYTAGKNEVLYFNAVDFAKKTVKIFANDERIYAPYYKQTSYAYYPSQAVNGILTIGNFKEGETVEIVIKTINGEVFKNEILQLGYMSLDKMTELNALYTDTVSNEKVGRESLTFDYSNTHGSDKYLLVPITYDEGWKCEIGGEKAEIKKAMGAYIALELPEGNGTVKLTHSTPGLSLGIIASVAGLMMCALLALMKKRDYAVPKIIGNVVFWAFTAVYTAAFILVYFVCILFFIKIMVETIKKDAAAVITQSGDKLIPIN